MHKSHFQFLKTFYLYHKIHTLLVIVTEHLSFSVVMSSRSFLLCSKKIRCGFRSCKIAPAKFCMNQICPFSDMMLLVFVAPKVGDFHQIWSIRVAWQIRYTKVWVLIAICNSLVIFHSFLKHWLIEGIAFVSQQRFHILWKQTKNLFLISKSIGWSQFKQKTFSGMKTKLDGANEGSCNAGLTKYF